MSRVSSIYVKFLAMAFCLAMALMMGAAAMASSPLYITSQTTSTVKAEKETPSLSETIRISQKQTGRSYPFSAQATHSVFVQKFNPPAQLLGRHLPGHGAFLFLHMLKLF